MHYSLLIRIVFAGVFAMLFAFIPATINWGWTGYNLLVLNSKTAEEFVFYQQPVDVLKDSYALDESPQFNFIKTYGVSGPIYGENTIVCKGWRSEIFSGKGFIHEEQVGVQESTPTEPFTWGGNLPDEPVNNCVLRSVIELCDDNFGVCKTVDTESEVFRFE